jgi:hypothetical protein
MENLTIAKPKRSSDGTFTCNIKQPFIINLQNSQLVHIKETNDQAQFIFLKNKNLYNYVYDLNNNIIEIVKSNCSSWFNTNMNPDLIDDYYTNTLIYDKTHGDLIKLKLTGTDLLPNELIGNNINIELNAIHLRFYKQKFVLETTIKTYEIASDIIDFSDEENTILSDNEDDEPYPSQTELDEMKMEVVHKLQAEINEINEKLIVLNKQKNKMEEAREIQEIIKLYNEFQ